MLDRSRVARFLAAGSAGFAVDALILSALCNGLGWSPYLGRALSAAAAVVLTWHLNRTFTFRDRTGSPTGPEFARYVLVQTSGVLVNYSIFSVVVVLSDRAARWPALALVPAAAIAMCVTYLGMHYFAFPPRLKTAHD